MDKSEIANLPAQNLRWGRNLCEVLEEMRKCCKNLNFALMPSLIEEAQTYGNRMEAKLEDVKAYEEMKKRYKEMKKGVE